MKKLLLLVLIFTGCGYTAYYNTFYNAKNYYKKAIESTPPNQTYLDNSIKGCQKLIKYYPTSKWVPDALLLMGQAFLGKKDYDNAIIKFEELIEYYPDYRSIDEAYLGLGRVYIEKGDYIRAELVLKNLEKNKEASVKLLIDSYFFSGDYEKAVQLGKDFLSTFPASKLKENVLMVLANICDSTKNTKDAVKYYEEVLKLTNKKIIPSIAISKNLLALGSPDSALSQLSRFQEIATMEEQIEIGIVKARCYTVKQEYEKAIDILKNIQNSARALYEIGVIYEENLGDMEKAKEYYEDAGKMGDLEIANKGTARAGRIERLLKYTGVEQDSIQADSIKAEEGENQFMLAELYLLDFNDPDRAMKEYEQVIQSFPQSKYTAKALYSIAWILEHEKNDTAKAVMKYEEVKKKFPDTEYAEQSMLAQNKLLGTPLVEVIEKKKHKAKETLTGESFSIQVGAYSSKEKADEVYEKLKHNYDNVYIFDDQPYWKVRIGKYGDKKKATTIRDKLQNEGYKDSWLVRELVSRNNQ